MLAVSGGADSVALLHAMRSLGGGGEGRICVAHFNHHLRSSESDADEAFVVRLCLREGTTCIVGHGYGSLLKAAGADGLEAAARAARYRFLRDTAEQLGARYVVTAHNADDQAETILHRIIRGTGIGGLSGISRVRPFGGAASLIRPLLALRHAELVAYLDDVGQAYCNDSSNAEQCFTRNRIRHDLLPRIARQYNPNVADALLRLGALATESQRVIDTLVDALAERYVRSVDGATLQIDVAIGDQPRYLIRELMMRVWREQGWPMQAMGREQWETLADMLLTSANATKRQNATEAASKHSFPGNVTAEATVGVLRLTRTPAD